MPSRIHLSRSLGDEGKANDTSHPTEEDTDHGDCSCFIDNLLRAADVYARTQACTQSSCTHSPASLHHHQSPSKRSGGGGGKYGMGEKALRLAWREAFEDVLGRKRELMWDV